MSDASDSTVTATGNTVTVTVEIDVATLDAIRSFGHSPASALELLADFDHLDEEMRGDFEP